ncbi:hypothetical protein NQ314_009803 [Rhamnusium bicolor]|uniref:Uncharacterized protein n=1 Tax=Rhamnusium bicolor TaxID=1586634 RepID=A0AAV8XX04_9CUCU|nr:hypothetical protein NQ314_009803 [Rhamnusium bicolor]
MAAYSSPLRKTAKWYRKLAIELILNTSMVNAYVLYTEVAGNKNKIVEFRKKIIQYLCSKTEEARQVQTNENQVRKRRHELTLVEGAKHTVRKYCKQCYTNISEQGERKNAKNKTKKVNTMCKDCEGQPFFCLDCFNKIHKAVN